MWHDEQLWNLYEELVPLIVPHFEILTKVYFKRTYAGGGDRGGKYSPTLLLNLWPDNESI